MRHVILWCIVLLMLVGIPLLVSPDARCAWTSRSGGLVVFVGILWESWPLLVTPRADDLEFWTSQERHTAVRHALSVVCVGTLIWAIAEPLCQLIDG